jgi:hypothetical protein
MMGKAVEDMNLDELEAERARLAEQRTALRLQQNAVEEMWAFRKATEGLPPNLVNRIALKGEAGAKGAMA